MNIHPAAKAFPLMDPGRLAELIEDIRQHGQREPITLYEGQILDGRNRARACEALGIVPQTREYCGDPWQYVWSLNGARRDLVAEQRYLSWKLCIEESAAWQAMQQQIRDATREKHRAAVAEQPRIGGMFATKEAQPIVEHSVPVSVKENGHVSRVTHATLSKTNPGAVQRGETLLRHRPDLAEKVRLGELAPAQAHRQLQRDAQLAPIAAGAARECWAAAMAGLHDTERFARLGITLQPYDVLYFSSSDARFGTSDYPGRIPAQLVAHVLHWFTKPGETVLDPMAGGGTVPDVCLVMGRACYAYDINASSRVDILPHDLAVDGWPERIKTADLIFWDPPYFAKKDEGYPEGSISRLDRTRYLKFFATAFAAAKEQAKRGTRLAFLMSDWNDHEGKQPGIFLWDYADLLRQAGWTLTEHLQVPLSTQQVHPDIVTKFRQSGRRARLERYLLLAEKR